MSLCKRWGTLMWAAYFMVQPIVLQARETQKNPQHVPSQKQVISVAVVPYAEEVTPELEKLAASITQELKAQEHVEVRDARSTQEILQYYLDAVVGSEHQTAFDQRMQQVREDYTQLRTEQAWNTLQQLETQLHDQMQSGASNAPYLDLLTLKAKLAYLKGKTELVPVLYRQIVTLNPDITYEHGLYSKWEIKALEQAKTELKAKKFATIQLQSNPVGSEVYLNGVHKGVTYYNQPLNLAVSPGRHCIEVKTVHHKNFLQYVDLAEEQTQNVSAQLSREKQVPREHTKVTISPSRFQTSAELSNLITQLGYYLKVDKVILVHKSDDAQKNMLNYQIGDTQLGAVYKLQNTPFGKHEKNELAFISREMNESLQKDIFSQPQDLLVTQSVGSLKLHERRKRPFHKQPLFWILVTAGAATGGIASVLLGGGAAAATTGGVIISL